MCEYKYLRPVYPDIDWGALQKLNQEELAHIIGIDKYAFYKNAILGENPKAFREFYFGKPYESD